MTSYWDPYLTKIIVIHDEIGWETDDTLDDWFTHLYDEEADEFKMHEFVDMEDFQQ